MKNSPLAPYVHRMNTVAKNGPEAFERYIASDEFLQRFAALPGKLRRKAVEAVVAASAIAAQRDRLPPPVKPKAAVGTARVPRWNDPAQQQKLREALAWAKGDIEKAARKLRVTVGAAKLAKRRYLDAQQPLRDAA